MKLKTEKEVIHQLWKLHKLETKDEINGFMKGYQDVEEELKDFMIEPVVTPAHLTKVLNDISIAVNEYPGDSNEWRVRLLGKMLGSYFLFLRYFVMHQVHFNQLFASDGWERRVDYVKRISKEIKNKLIDNGDFATIKLIRIELEIFSKESWVSGSQTLLKPLIKIFN
jgi:hypothetical protein